MGAGSMGGRFTKERRGWNRIGQGRQCHTLFRGLGIGKTADFCSKEDIPERLDLAGGAGEKDIANGKNKRSSWSTTRYFVGKNRETTLTTANMIGHKPTG